MAALSTDADAPTSSLKARLKRLLLSEAKKRWQSEVTDLGEGALAPFRVTPLATIDRVVQELGLTSDDVLWDLGCGEAHWCIAASKASGCRSVGVELSPEIAERGRARVLNELGRSGSSSGSGGHEDGPTVSSSLVRIEVRDMMAPGGLDGLEEATVVVVYMARKASRWLSPELRKRLQPGTRIVAVHFSIPDWVPVRVDTWKTGRVFHYVVEAPGSESAVQAAAQDVVAQDVVDPSLGGDDE